MKRTISQLFAVLLSVFLPCAGHSFVKIAPQVVNVGSGAGSGAAGAATGSYGSRTNLSVQPVLTGNFGQTTIINVNTPNVHVNNQGSAAVAIPSNLRLYQERSREGRMPSGPKAVNSRGKTTFINTGSDNAGIGAVSRSEGEAPKTGVQKLDSAMKGITEARKGEREKKLPIGAVATKLDKLFDFSRAKSRGDFGKGLPGARGAKPAGSAVVSLKGLPDPGKVGPEKAVSKLSALAANANATEAPFLYKRAIDIAREAGKTKVAGKILTKAAKRAKAAVNEAGNLAFSAAAKGRTTDALRYTKSVYGWDNLISRPGRPMIANFPQFKNSVKHVLAEALESPGKNLPAPTVSFKKLPGNTGPQVAARISMPEEISSPIKALTADFVADLALPDSVVAWEEVERLELGGSLVGLSESFDLTPQAGFTAFFGAQRKAGHSILKSFWIAARATLGSAASNFWQLIRSLINSVFNALGIFSSASGLRVDASPSALARLRSRPVQTLELSREASDAALNQDRLNLGYQLYPVTP